MPWRKCQFIFHDTSHSDGSLDNFLCASSTFYVRRKHVARVMQANHLLSSVIRYNRKHNSSTQQKICNLSEPDQTNSASTNTDLRTTTTVYLIRTIIIHGVFCLIPRCLCKYAENLTITVASMLCIKRFLHRISSSAIIVREMATF